MDIKTIKIKLIAIFSAILFCTYGETKHRAILFYQDKCVTIYHINISTNLINEIDSIKTANRFPYYFVNCSKYELKEK